MSIDDNATPDGSTSVSFQVLTASSHDKTNSEELDTTQPCIEGDDNQIKWMQDPDISPLIAWIENKYRPEDSEFRLQGRALQAFWLLKYCLYISDGVLYYTWMDRSGQKHCLVVPNPYDSMSFRPT